MAGGLTWVSVVFGSEEFLEKYRTAIHKLKTKSNYILTSGMLPRTKAEKTFYDKAFTTNYRIQSLCVQEKVGFMNLWDLFYNKPSLFMQDGLHLNGIGLRRLAQLLNGSVSLYR